VIVSVHMSVGIKFCTFLYWNIQINGIWHQAGGLDPVCKLVFVKIENNNLLCVVLIKTIVFDNVHNYLISKTTFHSLLKCVPGILKFFRSANNDLYNLYSQVFYPFLFRLNKWWVKYILD
jgi:hypothetical protein